MMASNSRIEWTGRTWNPVTGCDKVSAGCDKCYAENIAHRFAGRAAFPNGFAVTLRPERLAEPLRWRKPQTVFVNSMSDLFHHEIPDEFIARVFAAMAATPQHTYQVLTKRPARMRALLLSEVFRQRVMGAASAGAMNYPKRLDGGGLAQIVWPLPNVWLGVSVEDQKHADTRIPHLLATPAAVRFISAEPLLGPLDLREHIGLPWNRAVQHGHENPRHTLGPYDFDDPFSRIDCGDCGFDAYPSPLSWVIVGGESGPGARPMELDWVRDIRDQCANAGVALFVKQLGAVWAKANRSTSRKGGDPADWPQDLQIREMPPAPTLAPA